MEWWVQCGNCFSCTSPLTSTSIFLTSCGHLVCNYCLSKAPLPTPKPCNTGYCYDCKKLCSVINLDQRDKLNPDIAFYFQDPTSLLQKIVEVDKFQSLHRERRVENILRKRFIDDIVVARLIREKTEKYIPFVAKLQHILCSKYGINPGNINQRVDYSQEEIDKFISGLVEFQRQQKQRSVLSAVMTDPDGSVMETDQRTPSQFSQTTPSQRRTPSSAESRGSQSSLFRARVQSEMRGENAAQYSMKTTPTGSNKPSPLLTSIRLQSPRLLQKPSPRLYPNTGIHTPPPTYRPPQVYGHRPPLLSSVPQHQFRGGHPMSTPLRPIMPLQMGTTPVNYRPPGVGGVMLNSTRRIPGPPQSGSVRPHQYYRMPVSNTQQHSTPMLTSPIMTARLTEIDHQSNRTYHQPGSYFSSAALRNVT